MMLPWQKRPLALNSPRDLPGLALWLDSKDVSSLRNNAGAQPVTTDGIKLASDKSGNSSVNVLCLNGVAGNFASAADSAALSITVDIDIQANVALNDWTPAAANVVCARWAGGGASSFIFRVIASGGLQLSYSLDGTAIISATSTATVSFSDLSSGWVRATKQSSSGTVKFYTSKNGSSWTQLGDDVAATSGAMFDGAQSLEIGTRNAGSAEPLSGLVYRVRILNGYDGAGTLVFDANFATAAKLATSFTESSSNAATVTINTSGATGARISGARDLYQGTAANQPILTIAASGNYLTFDGSNDYLKAAAFALAQPTTVYLAGSQVTWTNGDTFYAGNANGQCVLFQDTTTPEFSAFSGTSTTRNDDLAVATNGIITAVFNNASSLTRVNRLAAVTGTTGATAANGFTLGSNGNGTSGWSNITASEVLVYSTAHDKATQDRVIAYLANRNRIALT